MIGFRSNCLEAGRGIRTCLSAAFSRPLLAAFVALSVGVFAGCACRSNLPSQIAAARTPADHEAIARALQAQAGEYAAAAAYHRGLAAKYENLAGPNAQYQIYDSADLRMAEHCRKVAEDLERAASDLTELAHEHERLAGQPQKQGQ